MSRGDQPFETTAPPLPDGRAEGQAQPAGPEDEAQFRCRWLALFGLSYPICDDEDDLDDPDGYISVYVDEDLHASGYGIANAIREPAKV